MAPIQRAVANSRSTHNRLHSICNTFKQCFLYENLGQTNHVPNMVPEFPSCCQSAKSPIEYRIFYQHCHTGFQRLLVACDEMPLRSLIWLPPSRTWPVCHTFSGTCPGKIICTRLYNITLQTHSYRFFNILLAAHLNIFS